MSEHDLDSRDWSDVVNIERRLARIELDAVLTRMAEIDPVTARAERERVATQRIERAKLFRQIVSRREPTATELWPD